MKRSCPPLLPGYLLSGAPVLLLLASCQTIRTSPTTLTPVITESPTPLATPLPMPSATPSHGPTATSTPLTPTQSPLCPESYCTYELHSVTDSGVILWEFRLADFAMICFKFNPEEIPYWQQNAWIGVSPTGTRWYLLIAGAYGTGDPPSQGALFAFPPGSPDPCSPVVFLAPLHDGPLEIVGALDHRFLLRSITNHVYMEFDLVSERFYQPISEITPLSPEDATPPVQ